jgi:hypothetical protein
VQLALHPFPLRAVAIGLSPAQKLRGGRSEMLLQPICHRDFLTKILFADLNDVLLLGGFCGGNENCV